MTIVYSRLQASEHDYRGKITKELDEDSNGLLFDFKNDNDNIINVEYSGKLIALVEKQGNDYIIERVAGTPQPSEIIPQETEHSGETEHGEDAIRLTPQKEQQESEQGQTLKDNIIRVNFG